MWQGLRAWLFSTRSCPPVCCAAAVATAAAEDMGSNGTAPLWSPTPRSGRPPPDSATAVAIVVVLSALAVVACVRLFVHWRQVRVARQAAEIARRHAKAQAALEIVRRGGPTRCSPTRSGQEDHAEALANERRARAVLDVRSLIRLDGGAAGAEHGSKPAPPPRPGLQRRPAELAFMDESSDEERGSAGVGAAMI